MRIPGLPRRVLLIPSNNIHIETTEAIRLLGMRRAREVYSSSGEFQGIELGHFGPMPSLGHAEILPPAELPGLRFKYAQQDTTHAFIMDLAYRGIGAEFA